VQQFKNAMSRLASGVGIAACWRADRPVGLLVSSMTSVSADPPRVLFCVQKTAHSHDSFLEASHCSLNILAEDDHAEADKFSSWARHAERFDPALWGLDRRSPPAYAAALIELAGSIIHRLDAGTHSVFVVHVDKARVREAAPLIYFDRRYGRLRSQSEV
jgi:flavin reductase